MTASKISQPPGRKADIPWKIMSFYEKFEQIVAISLSCVIAFIIIVSLIQSIRTFITLSLGNGFHPLNHQAFQNMFGMIMTLLIAMEFKHSIIQVKTIIIDCTDRAVEKICDSFFGFGTHLHSGIGYGDSRPGLRVLAASRARRPAVQAVRLIFMDSMRRSSCRMPHQ